jgi:hypothetical protein
MYTLQSQITEFKHYVYAAIAQLGERQTEDLKVPGSIPGVGTLFELHILNPSLLYRFVARDLPYNSSWCSW